MGNQQRDTEQTTGSKPNETSQVGTHGNSGSKDWSQGQGSQNKGQGQYQGQGRPMTSDQNEWSDRSTREMQQGDETGPAEASGTGPLDQDQQPINQNRPVQQNR
ncbi:MAG TPA: hypothetical protein VM408_08390 [Methylomirabilota bacterium]|nr:hypothetical protein [Methylomirabilota bacterium]